MATIVTRSGKGVSLTHNEVDANFTNLNTDKAEVSDVILATEKGAASGVAPLDATSKISSTYLPSYVDDVLEYANYAALPATGETGKIYVALDTNKTYRWSGSAYIYITSGAVDSVAGKTGVVTLDKTDVGLSNVSNTAQVTSVTGTSPIISSGGVTPSISISAATTTDAGSMSAADKAKIDAVTGTNTGDETASTIKTKLGITTLSGSNTGDQTIPTTLPASDVYAWAKAATKPTYTANDVGLNNVDNTTDALKPISTATQTALDLKAPLASPTFTGTVNTANLAYTGTLTGGTGILNIGSGQLYKDASGNVGIGTSSSGSPGGKLHVTGDVNGYICVERGGIPSAMLMRRANGSITSPTQVLSGDILSVFSTQGYTNASAYSPTIARIAASAAENFTNTGNGTYLSFETTSIGTATLTERLRITSAGGISFGSSGTAYGTSGQVLLSAGNAAPVWTNQSSIAAGTASNITAYTINQNVGTANAVQHSDITTARVGSLTTGYVYYGNTGTKYAGFDGTNFVSSMPMSFNILGSSASCTGNAATASTASQLTGAAPNGIFRYTPNLHFNSGSGYALYVNWDNNNTTYTPSSVNQFVIGNGSGAGVFYVNGAGTVTASGSISGTNITSGGNVTGSSTSCTGNAATSSSCTGNAATATTLIGDATNWASYRSSAVANMLSWKNYGNGHVIFDASQSTAPNGTAINNTNPSNAWTASYPTLMGWNGGSTFGVRTYISNYSETCTGNAATSSDSIGNGQTWQNVLASRAKNTTYTNSTGRSIEVYIMGSVTSTTITINCNGVAVAFINGSGSGVPNSFIVPSGGTYIWASASGTLSVWSELR